MALAGWLVETYIASWTSTGEYLPYPWSVAYKEDYGVKIKTLASGAKAKLQAVTTEWMTIEFSWGKMDSTEFAIWKALAIAQTVVRITDLNSNQYIGTFIKFEKTNELIVDGTVQYQVAATFEQSPDPS